MKYIVLFTLLLHSLLFAEDQIANETKKPMLCNILYPAKYEMQNINGIEQRVQTQKQVYFTEIIQPDKSYLRKADETITCYNEFAKISSYKAGNVQNTDAKSLDMFKRNHELFDIASYVNEDKNFVETKYGTSNLCKEYKDGEYCKFKNGLDIFYTKSGRVKKIYIYGSPLYGLAGNLPFEIDSFYKIRASNEPLGLWVSEKNREIIKTKPTFETDNVIVWENPTPNIKRVVMTPKNGFINLNRYGIKDQEQKLEDYLQAIEVEYVLDDKAYELNQKTRIMPEPSPYANPRHLAVEQYPRKAKNTWGETLNLTNKIPTNKFQAFYINTKNPKSVIASEEVPKVNVNYPWDKFHGIKSEDFGGYWVGNFVYEDTKDMSINISQSWSKTRIIIDNMVIYEGGNNLEIPFKFTKGKHKIEVEYVNNWHTTNFVVSIKEKEKVYTATDIREELKKHTSQDSKVVLVGAYNSKNKNNEITLKIAKSPTPIILLLNSYDSIQWNIKNPYNVKIEAIVYSAYKPGVEIKGDVPKSIPIMAYKGNIGSYKMQRKCSCINGGALFNCDGTNGIDTIHTVESLMGKKMFGFSVQPNGETFIVPNTLVDAKKIKELEAEVLDIEKQRKECQKQTNPNFENIFDK